MPHSRAGRHRSKRRRKFADEAYLADMINTPCILRLVRVNAEPERGSPAIAVLKLSMFIVHHAATRSVFHLLGSRIVKIGSTTQPYCRALNKLGHSNSSI